MSLTSRQKNRLLYALLMAACILGFWWIENFYTSDPYASAEGADNAYDLPLAWVPDYPGGEPVRHDYYRLSYSEPYEQAAWVAYMLQPRQLTRHDRERPFFVEDPQVSTHSADWRNYRGSGFDRGHLCPAGDMRFSEAAYNQTFYTSNISPQNREFNAGIWNELEVQVRRWCRRYGPLCVITGGILEPGLPAIGEEKVAVPSRFFKVVIREGADGIRVLAFLMENRPASGPLPGFLVTLDQLEELSGIDFFPGLPQQVQRELEASVQAEGWTF
ncbi:MAG TPA: DNA/RNA non-specific endonuclease [Robiginitalea sp.]|nr:DNA/RNA non-specific endonuclease [Robiginitalea sp.]